jgi:hypothetical protein
MMNSPIKRPVKAYCQMNLATARQSAFFERYPKMKNRVEIEEKIHGF